jgi:sugar O-acyltransferase (sialic acid O-acetyltransferase NeuD family)
MIIIGTGGLAKDVIASMEQDSGNLLSSVCFFDNINIEIDKLFDYYPVYHQFEQLEEIFEKYGNDFIVGIGNPLLRKRIIEKFERLGGQLSFYISQKTCAISPLTKIDSGVFIQQGCIVSRNVILEKGVFVNASAVLGHDVILREYVSIGPGAKILGYAEIGEFSYIGTNAVIMPHVKIGKKVRIGIGKIITEDVPDNAKIM